MNACMHLLLQHGERRSVALQILQQLLEHLFLECVAPVVHDGGVNFRGSKASRQMGEKKERRGEKEREKGTENENEP